MAYKNVYDLLKETEKKLLKELESLDDLEKKQIILWEESLATKEIAEALGLSIVSVCRSIKRMLIEKEIIEVRNNQQLRRKRYSVKSKEVNQIVNDGYVDCDRDNKHNNSKDILEERKP